MFPTYRRCSLFCIVMLALLVTRLTFGQPSSISEIDSLKFQLLKLQEDFKSLEKRVQTLEKGLKKVVPSTSVPSAQALNIETATPNTKRSPVSLSASSIPIIWNRTGKMVLQIYLDENPDPIHNEEHSPGDVIKLPANKVVELKIWIPRSPTPYKSLWVSTP